MELDVVGAPVARVSDVHKALKLAYEMTTRQVSRLELRVVAVGGTPQPSHAAILSALSEVRPALDISAALGSDAAGFGAGAWLVVRVAPLTLMQPFPPASPHEVCEDPQEPIPFPEIRVVHNWSHI